MGQGKMIEINDANFDTEILKAAKPALLDFSATWCGPCRALEKVMDEVIVKYGDRVAFGHVDIDQAPSLAQRYMIRSVPTLILFKQGAPAGQIVGLVAKEKISDLIDRAF